MRERERMKKREMGREGERGSVSVRVRERERERDRNSGYRPFDPDEVTHQGADHFHKRFVVLKLCLSLSRQSTDVVTM
jgi:hypothetical protein